MGLERYVRVKECVISKCPRLLSALAGCSPTRRRNRGQAILLTVNVRTNSAPTVDCNAKPIELGSFHRDPKVSDVLDIIYIVDKVPVIIVGDGPQVVIISINKECSILIDIVG